MSATTLRVVGIAALAAFCACSTPSGPTSSLPPAPSTHRVGERDRGAFTTLVGVGDDLTAGYQAGGFLGATGYANPLDPGTQVPPGQENGWWADVYEMSSGLPEATAIDRMYDPSTSPLPLIKGPGLNNQLVQSSGIPPLGLLKPGNACTADGSFDAEGYRLDGLATVRMNPASPLIRDVAVPGMTAHEAISIAQPQSDTCVPLAGIPGLLAEVVDDESSTFWPVLGSFSHMGSRLSEVRAAAALRPTLATVWLGANDVLKYVGSGGRFVGGDSSAAETKADLLDAIQTLKYAGAKTVVLNLPDVLNTAYFMQVTIPQHAARTCNAKIRTYLYCVIDQYLGSSSATELTKEVATRYKLGTPAGCVPASTTKPCGYLTLQGALLGFQYLEKHGNLPNYDCTGAKFTKPCITGSGLGTYYITPDFAGRIQTLNDNVNTGIDEAAKYTQSALVDVRAIFDGIAGGDKRNPYFAKAISINPNLKPAPCCTLASGAGLASLDGLHPSNTGYALIAYYVIQSINERYGQHIPEIDVTKVYNGTRCSNKLECYPDVYAPH